MARILISYSRADRQFIDQFIPLIRRVYGNDSVWFDDDIHGGVDWWQLLLNEIEKCDIFVYLISNESLESPYCQAELREALRLNKQILPVIVRRLNPSYPGNIEDDLAVVLRRTQYVDMSGGFRDANTIASLIAALTRLLNAIPQQPLNPVTLTPTPQPPVLDKKRPDSNIRAAYIGGGFVLVAAIIAGIFGLWQGYFANSPLDNAEPTTAIAQNITETPTDAFTPTLSSFQILQTTEAQLTQSAGTQAAFQLTLTDQFISDSNATATAAQLAATETVAFATLLALSATPTPRPTNTVPSSAIFSTRTTLGPSPSPTDAVLCQLFILQNLSIFQETDINSNRVGNIFGGSIVDVFEISVRQNLRWYRLKTTNAQGASISGWIYYSQVLIEQSPCPLS